MSNAQHAIRVAREHLATTRQDSDSSLIIRMLLVKLECPDPNVMAVVEGHRTRAAVGMEKYHVDTARKDLTELEWLRHLQEELMDAAVYAQRLIEDREYLAHSATIEAFLDAHEMDLFDLKPRQVLEKFIGFAKRRK